MEDRYANNHYIGIVSYQSFLDWHLKLYQSFLAYQNDKRNRENKCKMV